MVATVKNGVVWFDGPASGAWNMAMDQAMLLYAAENDCIVLRIYQWSEPTLSLGYFQDYQDRLSVPHLEKTDCVRRVTGGGAILHDREITYSLAVPRSFENALQAPPNSESLLSTTEKSTLPKPVLRHSEALYRVVHAHTTQWLLELGFAASIFDSRKADSSTSSDKEEANQSIDTSLIQPDPKAFLCFDRRADVDIVVVQKNSQSTSRDQKVLGSAQRRSDSVLLQHGSLLLAPSPLAPHLCGLNQTLQGRDLEKSEVACEQPQHDATPWNWATDFCQVLQESIERLWNCQWSYDEQPQEVLQTADRIRKERFQNENWTAHKQLSPRNA